MSSLTYFSENDTEIIAHCRFCRRVSKVQKESLHRTENGFTVGHTMTCPCGNRYDSLEFEEPASTSTIGTMTDDLVYCPNCGSGQSVAGEQGFSVGGAIARLLLRNPLTAVFSGLLSVKEIQITCTHCGHKWQP